MMKKQGLKLLSAMLFFSLLIVSCSKDETSINNQTDLSKEVAGTYKGSIASSDEPGVTLDAGLQVTAVDNNTVRLNFTSPMIDTSFMMNLYENGDSVMICFTDSMFYHEYGHHMMGNGGPMDWDHHLSEQNNPGEHHYGGFNMHDHTFGYRIIRNDDPGNYYQFEGQRD